MFVDVDAERIAVREIARHPQRRDGGGNQRKQPAADDPARLAGRASSDGPARPQRLRQRAFVEVIELAADRQAWASWVRAPEGLEPLGE